jgi:hypothetical protein
VFVFFTRSGRAGSPARGEGEASSRVGRRGKPKRRRVAGSRPWSLAVAEEGMNCWGRRPGGRSQGGNHAAGRRRRASASLPCRCMRSAGPLCVGCWDAGLTRRVLAFWVPSHPIRGVGFRSSGQERGFVIPEFGRKIREAMVLLPAGTGVKGSDLYSDSRHHSSSAALSSHFSKVAGMINKKKVAFHC